MKKAKIFVVAGTRTEYLHWLKEQKPEIESKFVSSPRDLHGLRIDGIHQIVKTGTYFSRDDIREIDNVIAYIAIKEAGESH